jgi:hypothetical protein
MSDFNFFKDFFSQVWWIYALAIVANLALLAAGVAVVVWVLRTMGVIS